MHWYLVWNLMRISRERFSSLWNSSLIDWTLYRSTTPHLYFSVDRIGLKFKFKINTAPLLQRRLDPDCTSTCSSTGSVWNSKSKSTPNLYFRVDRIGLKFKLKNHDLSIYWSRVVMHLYLLVDRISLKFKIKINTAPLLPRRPNQNGIAWVSNAVAREIAWVLKSTEPDASTSTSASTGSVWNSKSKSTLHLYFHVVLASSIDLMIAIAWVLKLITIDSLIIEIERDAMLDYWYRDQNIISLLLAT